MYLNGIESIVSLGMIIIQSLSFVLLFAIFWTVVCHTSLSFTILNK